MVRFYQHFSKLMGTHSGTNPLSSILRNQLNRANSFCLRDFTGLTRAGIKDFTRLSASEKDARSLRVSYPGHRDSRLFCLSKFLSSGHIMQSCLGARIGGIEMEYPTLLNESCGFSLYKAVYNFHYERDRPHKVYPSIDLRVALDWTGYGWRWHWAWRQVRSVPIAAVVTGGDNLVRTVWVVTHNTDSWFRRRAIERLVGLCASQGILVILAPAKHRYHRDWVGQMMQAAKVNRNEKARSLIVSGEGVQCRHCTAPLKYHRGVRFPLGYFMCADRCRPRGWISWSEWLYIAAADWADNVPNMERAKELARLQDDLSGLSEKIGQLQE